VKYKGRKLWVSGGYIAECCDVQRHDGKVVCLELEYGRDADKCWINVEEIGKSAILIPETDEEFETTSRALGDPDLSDNDSLYSAYVKGFVDALKLIKKVNS
jgi:hypothetical protein